MSKHGLLTFLEALTSKSCEGETLALSVALLFELMAKGSDCGLVVASHPANQSGASSKEIADVDVFEPDGETPRHCAEAKDKPFTRADVDHAASKVAEAKHSGLIFIFGPNARTDEDLDALVQEYETKGFDLTFVSARNFAEGIVSLAPSISPGELIDLLNKHIEMTRAKELTIQHCKEVSEKI